MRQQAMLGFSKTFQVCLALTIGLLVWGDQTFAQDSKDLRSPSVGKAGQISQLLLPGSALIAKPLQPDSPMVVRIIRSFPHASGFHYDILFHGLEPGDYDLADWLERKDGSPAADLPEVPVHILSLLPPGQIEPNELETGWLPSLGGYRTLMIAAITAWTLVLLGLIFLGYKKAEPTEQKQKQKSLADLLQDRLQAVQDGDANPTMYAELERMLFGFWRRKLELEQDPPATALGKIHQHEEAGPLMRQLEQWMHNPAADKNVSLSELLEPFRNLPADLAVLES